MALKKVPKPKGDLTRSDDEPIEVRGQILAGYYDSDENYYEHNQTTGEWFLLVANRNNG